MSETAKSSNKSRRVLVVANPGSDSDDSGDDHHPRQYTSYPNPTSQSHYHPLPGATTHSPYVGKTAAVAPAPLTTNLFSDNSPHYPSSWSNPTLSSPSSTSSRALESTPPPITPSISSPLVDIIGEGSSIQDHSNTLGSNDRSEASQLSRAPQTNFYPRPSNQLQPRQPANSSPRLVPSPTSSNPEPYSSPVGPGSASTSDKLLIVVTADSERYLTVDITGAKNSAFIRERIFNKLCVWEEEHQSRFSIYQTEIGAFAIGEALTDDRLFDLCRDQGDSRGSLKFLVSHSSASVHEEVPSSSSSISPTVTTIPPPVLPYESNSYSPLKPKRRSVSRPPSQSSTSEHFPPEVSAGYEASVSDDVDNADRRLPSAPSALSLGNVPTSPLGNRRPNGTVPRSISPIGPLRPTSPSPAPGPSAWVPSNDPASSRDKYGQGVPGVLAAPPLSPNRPTFPVHDDTSLATLRAPHYRTGSDPAAVRENALRASENQLEDTQRQWKRHRDRGKADRQREGPRDGLVAREPPREKRQQGDVDDLDKPGGRGEAWVFGPRDNVLRGNRDQPPTPQDGGRTSSSTRTRPAHGYKSPSNYMRGLVIPNAPRNPPPMPPVSSNEPRNSPARQAGQPVPSNWAVTWKGEASQRRVPPSPQLSHLTKPIDKSKSMDNIRATALGNHPLGLQPGARRGPGQLPMSRTNGGSMGIYITGETANRRDAGLPKSYDRAIMRPPPLPSSSLDLTQSTQYGNRGYVSPGRDPYPRPSSALGDPLSSPSHRHGWNLQSPTHESDPDRSPRALSPSHVFGQTANMFGNRLNPNIDHNSDIQSGMEVPRTPPRSPVSPRDPRDSRDHPWHSEASSSTVCKNAHRVTFSLEENATTISSESTLRQEDHSWIARMLDGDGCPDGTIILDAKQSPDKRGITPASSQVIDISSHRSPISQEEDSDSEEEGTSLWKKPPEELLSAMPTSTVRCPVRGPALKVRIENTSGVQPVSVTSTAVSSSSVTASPPSANRPVDTLSVPQNETPGVRASTFRDVTWAPRPPPEDVYERLEEFFPGHDLDKPVIEASSGGTSPTAPDYTLIPPLPVNDKSRVRGKKSIRIVAEEHKKRIDRTSRPDPSSISSVLRKRSTKLWGSRLEEVTTAHAKAGFTVSLPDSPSGGPKPIFKWVRGELIGKGTYGRVYLALNATTGEMIAVKQVEMPTTASDKNDSRQITVVQALKMESETLKDLDHPNIVQYLGFEETPNFLSIFLEYVPGGSIGSCLQKHGAFDEDVTKSFMGQILGGLEYLHSRNILHRDLKADNILVETSGICKISDFGISKRTDDISGGAHTAMQGTVFWMAPEVINAQKKGYNFKIDIWSVGCVILEMWAGSRPWLGHEAFAVMFKLYQAKLPPPIPEGLVLSSLADDFRLQCFAINPDERPTAARLRQHRYLELPPGWVFTGFK